MTKQSTRKRTPTVKSKRTLRRDMLEDEKLGALPYCVRSLFKDLILLADDEGRLRANPRYVFTQVFRYDQDSIVTNEDIGDWLWLLHEEGFIKLYGVRGQVYAEVVGWLKHQDIGTPAPSQFPQHSRHVPRVPSREALTELSNPVIESSNLVNRASNRLSEFSNAVKSRHVALTAHEEEVEGEDEEESSPTPPRPAPARIVAAIDEDEILKACNRIGELLEPHVTIDAGMIAMQMETRLRRPHPFAKRRLPVSAWVRAAEAYAAKATKAVPPGEAPFKPDDPFGYYVGMIPTFEFDVAAVAVDHDAEQREAKQRELDEYERMLAEREAQPLGGAA